jgi:hypothetical protein
MDRGPEYALLRALADESIAQKGDKNASSEAQEEACAAKASELGFASVADLRAALIRIGKDVPIKLRGGTKAPVAANEPPPPANAQQAADTRTGLMGSLARLKDTVMSKVLSFFGYGDGP